jgi:hypothetical protein
MQPNINGRGEILANSDLGLHVGWRFKVALS